MTDDPVGATLDNDLSVSSSQGTGVILAENAHRPDANSKADDSDIIGDASAFDDKLVPDGWKTSYLGAAYAARVSALSLNENLVWVVVRPNGSKADVTLEPATTAIPLESSVTLSGGSGGRITGIHAPNGADMKRRTSAIVRITRSSQTGKRWTTRLAIRSATT